MFVIFVNLAMSTENTEFDLAVLIFALLLRQRVFLFLTFQLSLSQLSLFPFSLVLARVFPSSLSAPSLPPPLSSSSPHRHCWIGGVNTGRERALFHYARAEPGRSCSAPAPGSKVYCGFHFTFPQPIRAPHCSLWTLTPAKNSSQKTVWRQFPNFEPSSILVFLLLLLSFKWSASCGDGA